MEKRKPAQNRKGLIRSDGSPLFACRFSEGQSMSALRCLIKKALSPKFAHTPPEDRSVSSSGPLHGLKFLILTAILSTLGARSRQYEDRYTYEIVTGMKTGTHMR
ncbi:hypothetical protein RRG08_042232 [Elysia crispata]|uniref:Uncharacterized protein n=1 Tax=Elysia crispata TaxID=231223 RepID=A0AAE1E3Q2_9GAST|nr:hypothetical protein RRG08_042232 [Elysia crispata]